MKNIRTVMYVKRECVKPMKNFLPISISIIISALVAYGVVQYSGSKKATDTTIAETAYTRVMRTHTIRCGYSVRYPHIMKDPNSGKLSGVSYDYMQALGEKLSLKIEWVQEAGLGEMVQDLKVHKYDAFCTFVWPTAGRAREIDFIAPAARVPVLPYARKDDMRFDGSLAKMNSPMVRFVVIDGYAQTRMVSDQFPNAQKISLPETSSPDVPFQNVLANKGDIVLAEPPFAAEFNRKNGEVVRLIPGITLADFPESIAIPGNEYQLQRMLSLATDELVNNGTMKKIFQSYGVENFFISIAQANP